MTGQTKQQFIALSDSASFFVPSWQPALMLEYVLAQVPRDNPRIRYVGAAKGDQPHRIAEFYRLAGRARFVPEVLSFFELEDGDPESFFADADIVFIDGGSTRNLLAILREWDAVSALRRAYEHGVVLVGASAGASMMFDWCMTDSVRARISAYPGIGMQPGTICVHHGSREERRRSLADFLSSEEARFPAYGLDDGTALHFVSGELVRGVSVRADATCLRIDDQGAAPSMIALDRLAEVAPGDCEDERVCHRA